MWETKERVKLLDYHKNMEDYFETKSKLFQMLKPSNMAVINCDDKMGLKIAKDSKAKIVSVSKQTNADIYLTNLISCFDGVEFIVNYGNKKIPIASSLIGEYNVENILCAVSIALSLDIEPIMAINLSSTCSLILSPKSLILNILSLVQQALLPKDRRNSDVIFKLKNKLESLFQVDSEYDEIISRIKPFFETI